ncbi:DUF6262 family protein [Leptolyngbya sp. FACHB-17]|uniref:DUF6262 family protein n=1 Tax=unclassified Leptolyngbya TaxID=2650499 RepID=UPI0016807416|nr:DUF6262 family protein [Leptolyngbya sp. FACHB-17]MBD2078322.1 hypothetical protein [Leptolyngbya sp. FACHB-17]
MTVKRNTDGLRQNARKKRQEALDKVEQGIRQLLKEGKTVNFNTVSLTADVSKAFLYKEVAIKERIEHLRQQGSAKKEPKQKASDASKNAVIQTLRDRIKALEAEIRDLRKQNEVFGAQVLRARNLDQQVSGLQRENDQLRQHLVSTYQADINESDNSDLAAELVKLGVQLNTTIKRAVQEAPKEVLSKALESLKEASVERRVENPSGFFYRAVTDAWKPNEEYEQGNSNTAFNEWYHLAHEFGLVQAATQIEGIQCVLMDGKWIAFEEAASKYPSEHFKR